MKGPKWDMVYIMKINKIAENIGFLILAFLKLSTMLILEMIILVLIVGWCIS